MAATGLQNPRTSRPVQANLSVIDRAVGMEVLIELSRFETLAERRIRDCLREPECV